MTVVEILLLNTVLLSILPSTKYNLLQIFQIVALVVAALCVAVEGRLLYRRQAGPRLVVDKVQRDGLGAPIFADDKADPGYSAPHKGGYGKVGPVFTFVKTDPYANFKWGVRHVAGVEYGKR